MVLNIFSFSHMSKEEILNLVITLFFFCLPFIMAHFFGSFEDKKEKGNNETASEGTCKRCKIKAPCLRCEKKAKGRRKC